MVVAINTTIDGIVFNRTGEALDSDIRSALERSANTLLSAQGLRHINLEEVTTKTYIKAAFPKFVILHVLPQIKQVFGEKYVNEAFDGYKQKFGYLTKSHFAALMCPTVHGPFAYKRSYAHAIRPGIGLFLVALHSSGAITLPSSFSWPSIRNETPEGKVGRRREIGGLVASELLAFIRLLDSQTETLPHPAFESIGGDRKRKEWFLTYATKLLLATGWHRPEDIEINDLLSIKAAESILNGRDPAPLAYKALLDVLNVAFGSRVKVTTEDWTVAVRSQPSPVSDRGGAEVQRALIQSGPRLDRDLIEELLFIEPQWAKPERIRSLKRLPGIDVDVSAISETWLKLQDVYKQNSSRESYRQMLLALRWWNVYLFYYLPYWFSRFQNTSLRYPSSPSLLIKRVFISRLLEVQEEMPVTFVEFMNMQAQKRGWANNSYYGILLQVQRFFEFLERFSDEIPGCDGFVQPLSPRDYPRTSRPQASKKRPIPRRFFGIYLDYHEALIAYSCVVVNRVLSGEIREERLKNMRKCGVIDTCATSGDVGYVPILFTGTKAIPLRYIPNILDIRLRRLRGGRTVLLPHPHAITQNLVSLHTGLRHNHIQWLDRDKFDSCVGDDDSDFVQLFVNTDKQKTEPWAPHVNVRVIELLRAQRDWGDLIDEDGFDSFHFYNDNPKTKWPKFRPLFAYAKNGHPHSDDVYSEIWRRTLCGLQGLLPELNEYGRSRPLLKLLPPGHKRDDPKLAEKLKAYGAQFGPGEVCPLNVVSDITPHSARVAVVSQYITFLPTDLIGKFITGQRPGVVSYYVHLDAETIRAEQVHQAAHMRYAMLRHAFEPMYPHEGPSSYIHADDVNSNLARSMRTNLDDALVSYGCMSILFHEDGRNGVDVLRSTRAIDAAANKTEICPYGNRCPPEIVKELRGLQRCSICPYAVRSVDHLPAIVAKKRQVAEAVDELESLLSSDAKTLSSTYSSEELDTLEAERARLCEDLTGWILSEEILELARQRIATGQDVRKWAVQRPEIIEQDLRRVIVPTSLTEYLLARLGDVIAYPTLTGPQIRARFDLLRRELLARAGNLKAAFSREVPVDPAAECAGLLKSVIASTGVDAESLIRWLESNEHLEGISKNPIRLLYDETGEDGEQDQ